MYTILVPLASDTFLILSICLFKIRTGHGTTDEYIMPDGQRGGVGQGSTDGPQSWNAHLEPLSREFQQFTTGFKFYSPSNKVRFHQYLASIVDDVTILRNGFYALSREERLWQFTRTIISWQRLLRITGGDISADKCLLYSVSFKFKHQGEPAMETMAEAPGTVQYTSDDGIKCIIPRKDIYEAERNLGIQLAPTGQWNTEFAFRYKQLQIFGG